MKTKSKSSKAKNVSKIKMKRKSDEVKKLVVDKAEVVVVKSEEVYNKAVIKYQKELAKWRLKIEIAKHQLEDTSANTHEKLKFQLDKLERKYDETFEEFKEFEEASSDAWDDINDGLKSSFKTMKQAYKKAEKHFKD